MGELRPGHRLPSIRGLEAKLGINRNTVRRAYLDLQGEGLLIVRQGRAPEVAPGPARRGRRVQALPAAELARKMVREIESRGLDVIEFVSSFRQAASDHDSRHPKCAFVECSRHQADDLAQAIGAAWRRRVIGVDLEGLRREPGRIPPSVRHVLTTTWHLAEVRRLLGGRSRPARPLPSRPLQVREVTLRLTRESVEGIRRLAHLETGLILRDAESIPGYKQMIRRMVEVKGPVRAALVGKEDETLDLLRSVKGLVYSAPCREFVKERAPANLLAQELVYEPALDSLERLKMELFPSPARPSVRERAGKNA